MNVFTPIKLLELDVGDVLVLLRIAENWLCRNPDDPNISAVRVAISKLAATVSPKPIDPPLLRHK